MVHVKDVQQRPVHGLEIGVTGNGGTSVTGADGKARIPLAKDTKANSMVSIQIVKSPSGLDLVMVSPWDYRAQVPSFENQVDNFIEVVVVRRGDRALLESGNALVAVTKQIINKDAPKPGSNKEVPDDPSFRIADVAKVYGLSPTELDQAIRAWGAKARDPYDVGLAALYERNYAEAAKDLSESLDFRIKEAAKAKGQAADAAFYLGQTLYLQGKYKEAASAYQQAEDFREGDGTILINLGLSLARAGEYRNAEVVLLRARAVFEAGFGPNHPLVATADSALGDTLRLEGRFEEAKKALRQALELDEQAFGARSRRVAEDLNNLGGIIEEYDEDYLNAEFLYQRALEIDREVLSPNNPEISAALVNLALVRMKSKTDYRGERLLCQQALAIDEGAYGRQHPEVATDLSCLGQVARLERDYPTAESSYTRALEIDRLVFGPDNPETVMQEDILATFLMEKGDYAKAEPLFKHALEVGENTLGANHPKIAIRAANLALLYQKTRDFPDAELLYRRALKIDEIAYGADHLEVGNDLMNLVDLLWLEKKCSEATALSLRAVAIAEKKLGPDNPRTKSLRIHVDERNDSCRH